jgi:hypothetical protein
MRGWCATVGLLAIAGCTPWMVGVVEHRWRPFAPLGEVRAGLTRYLGYGDPATLRGGEASRGEAMGRSVPSRLLRAGVGRQGRVDCDTIGVERDAMPYVDVDPYAKPTVGRPKWVRFSRRCEGSGGEQAWPEGPKRTGGQEREGAAPSA